MRDVTCAFLKYARAKQTIYVKNSPDTIFFWLQIEWIIALNKQDVLVAKQKCFGGKKLCLISSAFGFKGKSNPILDYA